jgi:succinate-semialdehyde dehydrogenase / glutarate-semialdehyde dehydrogenase
MKVPTRHISVLDDESLLRDSAYIDGRWVRRGESGRIGVDNPAIGEVVGEVPALGRAQVAEAVNAAVQALPGWRARSGKQRARVLRRWFDLVTEHAEDLARLITLEEGKPLAEARGEVAYAADRPRLTP